MVKRKKSKKKIEKSAKKRKAKVYAQSKKARKTHTAQPMAVKKRVVKSKKRPAAKRGKPAGKPRAKSRKELELDKRERAIKQREAELRAQKKALETERFEQQKRLYEAEQRIKDVVDTAKQVNEIILYQQGKKHLVSPEAQKEIEEAQRRIVERLTHVETPEERIERMRQRWREVTGLIRSKYRTKREEILLWVQRNGFDIIEFWAEYRRRTA